jgi:pimeloyl-ACP methyl ester carboxylesterase
MKRLRSLSIGLLASVLVLLGAGATTEFLLELRELAAFPPPGRLVDIGGHRLHIQCDGPEGASPTVILEAGGNAFSAAWGLIQPEVANLTRVCSYDRAGLGWSDSGPSPRIAETAAEELHELLLNAREKGPFVLVGHSYGGVVIRKYFDLYPDDVAGLAFVDPSNRKQRSVLSDEERERLSQSIRDMRWHGRRGRFGLNRLFPPPQNEALPELYKTITAWPRHLIASADELLNMDRSLEDPAFPSQDFDDRPVIVLSESATRDDRERWRFKIQQHRLLTQRSEQGVHIIVEGASHISFMTNPEHAGVVVTAIDELLAVVRDPS